VKWLIIVLAVASIGIASPVATAAPAPRCAQDQITRVRTLDFGYAVRLNDCRVLIVTPLTSDTPAPSTGPAVVEERTWVTSAAQHHVVVRYGQTRVTDAAGNRYQTTARRIP
jgi:hypothetical protein